MVEFALKDFHTNMMEIHAGNFTSEDYEAIKENLLEQVATYQEHGSGWTFDRVESYDINVATFQRINNYDDKCFPKSVTEAIFPRNGKVANRDNDKLKRNMKKLNWQGIEFPADQVKASKKFENNNPGYAINVYGYDDTVNDEDDKYSIQRISDKILDPNIKIINLLLYSNAETNHYVIIKNMSRAF